MKKYLGLILISICIALSWSCEKLILGDDEVNNPEQNFELFWTDFDEHYGLFQARGWNWDSIYTAYRPTITPTTSRDELYQTFKEMIEYLDDSHTIIIDRQEKRYHVSGDSLSVVSEDEFSLDLLMNKYLENVKEEQGPYFHYGKVLGKDIGYIHLDNIESYDPEGIDNVMEELGQYSALILDLRQNGGGSDQIAERLAGAFANKEEFVYTVQNRNGLGHDDFEEPRKYYVKPLGSTNYTKPIIILNDIYTVSAAEVFLNYMRVLDHVTMIGTTTAGDFSDGGNRRFLPIGFEYSYSIQQFLLPDGTSLDGIGHIPDIYVRNSKENIANQEDLVIEKAIEFIDRI